MRFFTFVLFLLFAVSGSTQADVVNFDIEQTAGVYGPVTIGGSMEWNGNAGGHLFTNNWNDDDFLSFDTDTTVNSWEMTNQPWDEFNFGETFLIDVEMFDASNSSLWRQTIDLNSHVWLNPLTIVADVENVRSMTFYSPGAIHGSNFFLSIDNLTINSVASVPEPGSMSVLAALAMTGLCYRRRRN